MAAPISNVVQNPGIMGLGGTPGGMGMLNLAPVNFGAYKSTTALPQSPATAPLIAAPKTPTTTSPLASGSLSLMNPNANFNNTIGGVNGILKPTNTLSTQYPGMVGLAIGQSNAPIQNLGSSSPSQQTSTSTPFSQSQPPQQVTPPPTTQQQPVTTQQTQSTQPTQDAQNAAAQQAATLQSIIQKLVDQYGQTSPQVAKAQQDFQDFQKQYADSIASIAGRIEPLEFQQGQEAAVQGRYANMFPYYTAQLQAAQTGAGQQLGALQSAAGALAPVLQYGALTSPTTGQPISGGGTGGVTLPAAAQDFVNSLATQVKSGQMTRSDAESRLSAYGQPGIQALNSALGTGFNTNASNASAATTGQGQQIQTAAASTNAALDTIATAYANLSNLQTAGIPATNSIANWIGQQFGDAALAKFKTNLADARSQLIGVLNSSGGTPTGNEATALQYLPDNMTKQQFDTNVGTPQNPGIVRQLVAQKVGAFTQSGQQNNSSSSYSGTPMFGSFNGGK